MNIAVITRVPPDGDPRNLAFCGPVYLQTSNSPEDVQPISTVLGNPMAALMARTPVFVLGEILILDGDGREFAGRGRKPGKWGVELQNFGHDLEAAVRRAEELTR